MKYRITAEGVLETRLSGFDLINFPMLNKGTAFTENERTDFALHHISSRHGPGWTRIDEAQERWFGCSCMGQPLTCPQTLFERLHRAKERKQ